MQQGLRRRFMVLATIPAWALAGLLGACLLQAGPTGASPSLVAPNLDGGEAYRLSENKFPAQAPDGFEEKKNRKFALPENKFPAQLTDVDGNSIDVRKRMKGHRLVVITLKATWCPVCQRQLLRIKQRMSELDCGVTYLVLSPGPAEDLRAIRDNTEFPYPFIEDKNLDIANSLGLQMSETEIFPSIFILGKDLKVRWMQRGRGAQYYGDRELVDVVNCAGLI